MEGFSVSGEEYLRLPGMKTGQFYWEEYTASGMFYGSLPSTLSLEVGEDKIDREQSRHITSLCVFYK